jgi:hypothetical protein
VAELETTAHELGHHRRKGHGERAAPSFAIAGGDDYRPGAGAQTVVLLDHSTFQADPEIGAQ